MTFGLRTAVVVAASVCLTCFLLAFLSSSSSSSKEALQAREEVYMTGTMSANNFLASAPVQAEDPATENHPLMSRNLTLRSRVVDFFDAFRPFPWIKTQEEQTYAPSNVPSYAPTSMSTEEGSESPTFVPTFAPTEEDAPKATSTPTQAPTEEQIPTSMPTSTAAEASPVVTFRPGDLSVSQNGLLLSKGLTSRIVAETGEKVIYANGSQSRELCHGLPDGAAVIPDTRTGNKGGWIYTSNSEKGSGKGGVGSFTFDKNGRLIDYKMVLTGTSRNCSGGRLPWNAWASCEETDNGQIYQVDPTGRRKPQVITLGKDGGQFESLAYRIKDKNAPEFFVTEDSSDGALRRFIPENPDWQNPWEMLLGNGRTDFLVLDPKEGTFEFTSDRAKAQKSAEANYPNAEGIDIAGNQLYFVSKELKRLFILRLDAGTYTSETTERGAFDGEPDQIGRIVGSDSELLFFAEDGADGPGVFARDRAGRYFTILESRQNGDETTGIAFSLDRKHLYFAVQNVGVIYDVTREDGLPFDARTLDIKYHRAK